jgi:DNA polymerase-3 subunit epsilon
MKILVFDTETNDRPPFIPGTTKWVDDKRLLSKYDFENKEENCLWTEMLHQWPHIIQLAYILYDTENPAKSKIFNKYIDINKNDIVKISESTIEIHHITREKIANLPNNKKTTIDKVINEFLKDAQKADIIVGHNVDFDRKMIVSEILRLAPNPNLTKSLLNVMFDDSRFQCTQKITRSICKLKNPYEINSKKPFYKNPKLIESYEHFFGYSPNPDMLHDAIIDVVICLRVYCIILNEYSLEPFDIFNTNKKITNYIVMITPSDSLNKLPKGFNNSKDNDKYINKYINKNKSTRPRRYKYKTNKKSRRLHIY